MLVLPGKLVQVNWQSTTVEIAPATRYGHKSDAASIITDLCLFNPDPQDLALPLTFLSSDSKENQPPIPTLRIKKEIRNLAEEEIDENAAKALEDAAAALAQQSGQDPEIAKQYVRGAIQSAARKHKTYVTVKAGQKLYVQVSQRHRIKPGADGIFEFSTVAPMPQYLLMTGGSVHVAVLLPRAVDGFNPQLIEKTEGFGVQVADINGRTAVSWKWQNDPLLFVKYRY